MENRFDLDFYGFYACYQIACELSVYNFQIDYFHVEQFDFLLYGSYVQSTVSHLTRNKEDQ